MHPLAYGELPGLAHEYNMLMQTCMPHPRACSHRCSSAWVCTAKDVVHQECASTWMYARSSAGSMMPFSSNTLRHERR